MPLTRVLFSLLFLFGGTTSAAEPGLRSLNVRGLQVGGATTLTVDGDNLGPAPRLLLPFPAKQALKPKSTDKQAIFEVTLGGDVTPGFAHLRIATAGGVSQPLVIGVDRLPQRPFTSSAGALPAALHGLVSGSGVSETTFEGKAGDKVILEVEAHRLGSKLRPVLHLYGPNHLQLGWSWPTLAHFGDTRLEATLPADGTYTAAVHDAEYAAAAGSFFRLKLGRWDAVDGVFPPVIGSETKSVELLGPGGAVKVDLPVSGKKSLRIVPWPKEGTWTGPRPWAAVSGRPEVIERLSTGQTQDLPAGPVGVSGKLLLPNEEDRYRVPVKPGDKIKFEVFAERLGSPIDVALIVRSETGAVLTRADDSPGTLDTVLEYLVPAKTTALIVGVADAQGRGGPRGIYRLTIDPVKGSDAGDFSLTTPTQSLVIAAGGRLVFPVLVDRKGYNGPIELSAEGLPPGVKVTDATIPAGAEGMLVALQHEGSAGEAVIAAWKGRGSNGLERAVILKGHPLEKLQPWMASELAVAVTPAPKEAFAVNWNALAADTELTPGEKLVLPVKVTRPDTKDVVRLSLVSSQNARLPVRGAAAVALLKAESAAPLVLAAKAKEGALPITVPAQLPGTIYDLAVQAELLSPDKKTVLATAYTLAHRFEIHPPVTVTLSGPSKIETKAGSAVEIVGEVARRNKYKGAVTLTVTGLPAGLRAAPVTVRDGTSKFLIRLVVPATATAGTFNAIKLTPSVVPTPRLPNTRITGPDVELTLVVRAK